MRKKELLRIVPVFQVISSHCDLSTKTGEMVIIFIMDQNVGRIFSGKSCGKEMVVSRHPV
ncbi:MAG: Na-translocating system protein MpsC family protein [Bacillota bacterium]